MTNIFIKQLNLLLWKNFRLKRRKPVSLLVEILIPILVVLILVAIRRITPSNKVDLCELREKQMASMGPVPFIRDFICTFNTSCYNKTQIDWTGSNLNDFLAFMNNISMIYNSIMTTNFTIAGFIDWSNANPNLYDQFLRSMNYILLVISPILTSIKELLNGDKVSINLDVLGTKLCGSNQNDLNNFLQNFNFSLLNSNYSSQSCQVAFNKYFLNTKSRNLFNILNPLIFGKIYYYPNSQFTREIMRKANVTFKILDDLRLASVEWRLNFASWLLNNVSNISLLKEVGNVCTNYNSSICQIINSNLNSKSIQSYITSLTALFSLIENALNCTLLNKFTPVQSLLDIDNLVNQSLNNVFAGIVFVDDFQYLTSQNATFLNYQIRMPVSRIDSTKNFKVLDRLWTPIPKINTLSDFKYYTSGFMFLQESIDHAFIELITDNVSLNVGSSMQIMPYPCYLSDRLISFLSNLMPFLLVTAWVPSVSNLIKNIVYEKEHRLKEFMKVMGLNNLVHWLGWFTSTIIILIIPTILMTILLKLGKILVFSSPIIIFLILFFYVISFICQAFMISVFFDKASVASVSGGILYFVFYLPFLIFVILQDSMTAPMYYAAALLTQVSLSNSINFIVYWEQSTEGVQFSNMFDSTIMDLSFGVGHCLVMMWVDSVIYLLIAWYVETVFPGQYGIRKPWYFLFTKNYWCSDKCISNKSELFQNLANEITPNDTLNQNGFESEPTHLQLGISISNLVKIYPKSKTPAVNNLNLNFYQSQITAFLGHNGAGKTTTISILTGIFSPTSGTALILDNDIRTDMDKIRQKMGLCPQHNILFDNLTVEDHVYFYGLLKGMTKNEIRNVLPKIVDEVGLSKKIATFSKNLSGGMKRKLSVAMAFVGDSRIVFLDEPTAGVDPFARRGIWDLLMKYRREDKAIVLTTHHMDEADYLSDRIAIISQGKLQCCGSTVFLKKVFGDGYYLILVKNENVQWEDFKDAISISGSILLKFIKNYIPDAKMMEETRTQWTIVLPQNENNSSKFSSLFCDLDKSMEDLCIVSYGLSDTSLEEVFLKVADDPSGVVDQIKDKKITVERLDSLTDGGTFPRPKSVLSLRNRTEFSKLDYVSTTPFQSDMEYNLLTGFSLFWQQLIGLQIKRFHYTKRNIKSFIAEMILPILLILMTVGLLNISSPLSDLPLMEISPWLMMPKSRIVNLNTFYRKENIENSLIDALENSYRSDLGESGIRCMDPNIFQLKSFSCFRENNVNQWSAVTLTPVPISSPECDCSTTGNQICSDPLSGGPSISSRIMCSSDQLGNVTGYNISDYLLKKSKTFIKKQYGGYQFLLASNFGQSSKAIGESPIWNKINNTFINDLNSIKFLTYFQRFFNLSGIKTNFSRIWINSKGYVSMPAYENIFNNLLLRTKLNTSLDARKYGILVANFPLKNSQLNSETALFSQMFLEVSLAIFVIFGLSFIPASFVIFLIEERITGSKRQQFVSGVNPYLYWISNFLWDIIKYVIPVVIVILIFVVFNNQSYIGSKNLGAFVCLLLLYGLAIIPHMYPFSFFLSTPSTAFVILDAYNLLIGAGTTIATFFLDLLEDSDATLKPVNDILKKIFLIFPQYDLGRGMMDLSINYLKFNASGGLMTYDPFDWETTGQKLCSLIILFLFWSLVVFIMESGIINRELLGKLKNYNIKEKENSCNEDNDVIKERERVINQKDDFDILKVVNLTKIYNSQTNICNKSTKSSVSDILFNEKRQCAVNRICFGVGEGECFGLLGVNGAGKTTTFKMLTGEEDITKGDAFINGHSIINDIIGAHKNMGFCPQFDALHSLLTCEEQLYFYCRIRGIEPCLIKSTVELSLKNLSLIPHTKKLTQALSGGNKRKLSTAIAIIGFPKIVFLDEPTSGMDAGARRFLWNIVQRMTTLKKTAVILTSHNMEECEVLCHRLSIMVNGEMRCLGSVQHLKSKFGDDYYVKLRMNSMKFSENESENIKLIVKTEFPLGVSLKDENFITLQYRFDSTTKLSTIFKFFENLKINKVIVDYSVSQTSLDEIFINFAKDRMNDKNNFNNSSPLIEPHINECFDNSDE